MRISDWSSDVCSSDLAAASPRHSPSGPPPYALARRRLVVRCDSCIAPIMRQMTHAVEINHLRWRHLHALMIYWDSRWQPGGLLPCKTRIFRHLRSSMRGSSGRSRTEEHPSEIPSLMSNSY